MKVVMVTYKVRLSLNWALSTRRKKIPRCYPGVTQHPSVTLFWALGTRRKMIYPGVTRCPGMYSPGLSERLPNSLPCSQQGLPL